MIIKNLVLTAGIAIVLASCGGDKKTETTSTEGDAPQSMLADKPSDTESGKDIYKRTCAACHQPNGEGVPKAFPPLANADVLNADVNGAIDGVLHGRTGELIVNGETYNTDMAPLGGTLNDDEIASVLTYVYSQWNNNKSVVTAEMVKARR